MLENKMLYNRITGYDNLKFFCKIYKIQHFKEKINEYAKEFDDTGCKICEHCRGTGVNPKYEKVNKIINAMLYYYYSNSQVSIGRKSVAPYCGYCKGEGKIYQNQKIYEKYKREFKENYLWFCDDIFFFLTYIANNERIFDYIKSRAEYLGYQIRVRYAEGFLSPEHLKYGFKNLLL